ncbi:hypothetical protein FB45DRAFT_1038864 [Roridomyces roridus]|uniref:Uncharacterized protein n=1 Tax=Roridomyces roridus TaxID=1738132 RepID=A0AAD7FBN3_9AGAR|nr:hypothetical protein FB45DRAFT_1038864 [Roridomyces roridus]
MTHSTPRSNDHTHPCNIFFEYSIIAVFVLLFLTPAVLSCFPGTAGSALIAALLWVDGELLHGYAVLCIVLAIVYVPAGFGAVHEWLTKKLSNRAIDIAHSKSASALEAGIMPFPARLPPSNSYFTGTNRTLAIFYHTCIILIYIHNKGVVSPHHSGLENTRDASVFVVRGLGVDFVVLLGVELLARCVGELEVRLNMGEEEGYSLTDLDGDAAGSAFVEEKEREHSETVFGR